jgi:hypothetical protein
MGSDGSDLTGADSLQRRRSTPEVGTIVTSEQSAFCAMAKRLSQSHFVCNSAHGQVWLRLRHLVVEVSGHPRAGLRDK